MTPSRLAIVIGAIALIVTIIYPLSTNPGSGPPPPAIVTATPDYGATPAPAPRPVQSGVAVTALVAPATNAEPPALTAQADSAPVPPPPASFTASDTLIAIDAAAAAHGVPVALLRCLVSVETGGTFNPAAVGDNGQSFGAAQLYTAGLLPDFHARGGLSPFNPYEAVPYMARVIAAGGGPWNWRHAWEVCS